MAEPQPFEFPCACASIHASKSRTAERSLSAVTAERIRLAVGDSLLKRGEVKQREGEVSFFVSI